MVPISHHDVLIIHLLSILSLVCLELKTLQQIDPENNYQLHVDTELRIYHIRTTYGDLFIVDKLFPHIFVKRYADVKNIS